MISSSVIKPSFSWVVKSFSRFLIMIVGEKVFSSLLYAENLIDWPKRDWSKVSPSYNLKELTRSGWKYSP